MLLGVPAPAVPGGITALANEPVRRPAGPAANYCRCQRGADWGWCPLRLLPAPCQPCRQLSQNHPRASRWAPGGCRVGSLPTDAELVALPPRRVPGGGDRVGSQLASPVSVVDGGCWRGWVLREGERAGPAAGRGKGRRQLPWKQKIKSMHPASGLGGKLGLARAGSLYPQGDAAAPSPG